MANPNLFHLASSDQSLFYLGYIFGSVGNLISPGGQGGATVLNIVGTMMNYLNTLGLTVGAFLLVYIIVVGLLRTAAEGEFLGKSWSSVWVPIRMLMGIAGLFPIGAYSALQVMMMWIVVQGVGAGDTLWTTALNYINTMGSPLATVSISSLSTQQNMEYLFQSLICQASAKEKSNAQVTNGSNSTPLFYCGDLAHSGEQFCTNDQNTMLTLPSTGTTYAMGPGTTGGECGTLTMCDPVAQCTDQTTFSGVTACAGCKAQRATLQNIITTLGGIAQIFADGDSQYYSFYQAEKQATAPWLVAFCAAQQPPLSGKLCCSNNPGDTMMGQFLCPTTNFASLHSCLQNPAVDCTNVDYGASTTLSSLYMPYLLQGLVPSATSTTNFLQTAIKSYMDNVNNAMAQAIATLLATTTQTMSGWMQAAQQQGWITAGGYYYQMANNSNNNNQRIQPPVWASSNSPPSGAVATYRNNYNAANSLIGSIMANTSAPTSTAGAMLASQGNSNPGLQAVFSAASTAGSGLMTTFMSMLSGGNGPGNMVITPMANLVNLGQQLIEAADILFGVFTAIFVLLVMIDWGILILGNGVIPPNIGMAFILMFAPILYAVIGMLYSYGATLAVYIPLIPYTIFSMGAIGWMLAVVEAMVAMPFVALGIMTPGGEHEILGRAHNSLSYIFNLFLRPSLMIFGMITSMLFAGAAVTFINSTFMGVVNSVGMGGSLVEPFFFMAAYVSLIMVVMNKCFALIHLIPERALVWIGFQAVQYGEAEAVGKIEGAVSAAGGKAAGMAKSVGGGLAGKAKGMIKESKRMKKEQAAAAPKVEEDKGGGADNKLDENEPQG